MQRIICIILTVFLLFPALSISTLAASDTVSFSFDLTVDGKDTKEVKAGDIITVVLKLYRTDSAKPYTMYAMQDEIRYDSTFFELVENSTITNNGIVATDIGSVDRYREFYMNYLSMSGGTQWDAETLIGSFQLKVIADSGVAKITNQDYLVSKSGGSDDYLCDGKDITIILSPDCVVSFMTGDGSKLSDQIVQYGQKIQRPENPVKQGFSFDGWYKDIHLSDEWDFDNDIAQSNMSLYAKWTIDHGTSTPQEDNPTHSFFPWLLLLLLALVLLILRYNRHKKNK